MSERYLNLTEAAEVLGVSKKRLSNMMCSGILKQGVHFFRPARLGARFKQSALTEYIEGKNQSGDSNVIELKKGCVLRIPSTERIAVRK
jgi:predicted DNA-binding transcriptional regulator AlpA